MIWSKHNTLPNAGGMHQQSVKFVTFSLIALSTESKVSTKYIKKSSRKKPKGSSRRVRKR